MGHDARAASARAALDLLMDAAERAEALHNQLTEAEALDDHQACQYLIDTVKAQVPGIKNISDSFAWDLGAMTARMTQLQSDVSRLTDRVNLLEKERARKKQRVLLGEVAFMLDKVACDYVSQGQQTFCPGTTINELRTQARDDELTDDLKKRWTEFRDYVSNKGWSIGNLCTISRVTKQLRLDAAHSNNIDKANVTLHQLQQWAQQEAEPQHKSHILRFLELVASLGQDGKPLVPAQDLNAVICG